MIQLSGSAGSKSFIKLTLLLHIFKCQQTIATWRWVIASLLVAARHGVSAWLTARGLSPARGHYSAYPTRLAFPAVIIPNRKRERKKCLGVKCNSGRIAEVCRFVRYSRYFFKKKKRERNLSLSVLKTNYFPKNVCARSIIFFFTSSSFPRKKI